MLAEISIIVLNLFSQMAYQESSRTSRFNPHDSFSARLSHQATHQPRDEQLLGRGFNLYQTDSPGHPPNQYDRRAGVFQTDGTDETDSYQVVVAEPLPKYHNAADAELSCPKCHRGFMRNRHLELLEHMEVCK